jgi:pheromone shutdown-related protein TraB
MENRDNPNITRLRADHREVVLVGTAHVSRESAALVRSVIEAEGPDTVCVELCSSRYGAIRQQDQWRNMDIIKVIKEKKAFLLLSNLLLAAFQRRIAQKLGVKPGEEMIRAVEAADELGAEVHLADRDIRVTLLRTWRTMGWWDKIKVLFQMIFSAAGGIDEIKEEDIERMKQEDILQMLLADVEKSFPSLKTILIDERDLYLAHRIRNAPGEKIVAVVGAGHVPGIVRHWEAEIDMAALEAIPPKGRLGGLLKWIIPVAIVSLLAFGFFYGGREAGTRMITWWVAANGILAGVGAIAALGHPLTILSSVAAAPLIFFNPMIAAGWVSGLVEAFSRKPKVRDFETLYEDILSVRGFWRNKVTRILLVVVFTNLGSMVGSFVAVPLMLKVFGGV